MLDQPTRAPKDAVERKLVEFGCGSLGSLWGTPGYSHSIVPGGFDV